MPIVSTRRMSGPKLRALRIRRELSQADLAQKCAQAGRPVTQQHLSRLEVGSHKSYMPLVHALAASLDVDAEDLLEDAA